ncbi:hypothetical protein ACNQ2O_00625 [Mycoplasma sp. AA7A]|uniref:hypothetical protein n=1 Tax=Mycoplasma sp. AA7A TaxID=3401665 RepID=UPI003AAC3DB4
MILALREPQIAFKSPSQKLKEIQEQKPLSFWDRLLKPIVAFFVDTILEFTIDILSVVLPIAAIPAQIIKIGARFVKNVIVSAVAFGKVVWEDVLIATATEAVLFGFGKSLTYISKLGKAGKNIAKGIRYTKQTLRFLKKSISQKILYASKSILSKAVKNSKFLTAGVKKVLTPQNINKAIRAGRVTYAAIRNPFTLITKAITASRKLTKKFLQKNVYEKMANYYAIQLNKSLAKKQLNKNLANKYIRSQRLAKKGQFYFNSSWISGIRLYDERYWDQSEFVTFFLYFKKEATNSSINPKGKRPLQFTLPYQELMNFLNAPSKGSYYLNNWAWGWVKGQGRRKINELLELSNLDNVVADKLFRITEFYSNEPDDLWQTQQYNEYVKKHRTNKDQYFAYKVKDNNNNYTYKFTKNLGTAKKAGAYTHQAKRIKRR